MSKRQEIREKRKSEQNRQRFIAIGLMALGALLVAGLLIAPNFAPIGEISTEGVTSRPQADFNMMGDPDAPIKIIEYSDFQCSHCGSFYSSTEGLLVENYVEPGVVHFTYRSMGNWLSDNAGGGSTASRDSIAAAYCAGDQGKFWEYHDVLFINAPFVTGEEYTPRRLFAMAEALDLDAEAFRTCFESGKYESAAQQDYADGLAAGVQGTPSFEIVYVVNGETRRKFLEGAQPYAVFEENIKAALAEMGQ